MFVTKYWLILSSFAVVALGATSAVAGNFGIRFSYNSGPRCYTRYSPRTITYYHYIPVGRYRVCTPIVMHDDCTPNVAVRRSSPIWHYYASRTYRPHGKLRVHIPRAVRRSYSYHRSHHGSYQRCYNGRPHQRRGFGGGRHYRGRRPYSTISFHARH